MNILQGIERILCEARYCCGRIIVCTMLWQSFGIQSLNRLAADLFLWLIKSKHLQDGLSYYAVFHFLKHIDLMESVNEF